VNKFYAHQGHGFGEHDHIVSSVFAPSDSKNRISTIVMRYGGAQSRDGPTSQPVKTSPHGSMLRRCLSISPDSGNPVVLAGLCWWRDYAPLLRKAGLLTGLRKLINTDAMSFGDGPAEASLFILLQLPLWYRYRNRGSQLVFTNIRIVSNQRGLLDGKHYMSALGYTLKMCAEANRASFFEFTAFDRSGTGSHIMVRLARPRPFRPNETGLAVVKSRPHDTLRTIIVLAAKHHHKPAIGTEDNSYFDGFPELVTSDPSNSFHAKAYQYGNAIARLWSNSPATMPVGANPQSTEMVQRGAKGTSSLSSVETDDPRKEYSTEAAMARTDDQALTGNSSPTQGSKSSIRIVDLHRLHRNYGHPSASKMASLLRNVAVGQALISKERREAITSLGCSFCARRARRRTPSRAQDAIPRTSGLGQDLHLDIAHFIHPMQGPFAVLITTDKFSLYVSGAALEGSVNARNTVEAFLRTTFVPYTWVTYDMKMNYQNADFRRVLERLG
jgi:hypothetical protein